jgi:hypothetical protein
MDPAHTGIGHPNGIMKEQKRLLERWEEIRRDTNRIIKQYLREGENARSGLELGRRAEGEQKMNTQ